MRRPVYHRVSASSDNISFTFWNMVKFHAPENTHALWAQCHLHSRNFHLHFETMYWNDRLLTCWGKQPSVNKEKKAKSFTLSFKVKKQRRTDVLFLSACLQRWSARPLRSLWSAFSSCSSALCSAILATSGLIEPSWPLSPESSLSCQVIGFIFRKSNIMDLFCLFLN